MTVKSPARVEVVTGNHAVSHAARLARVEVISAYPITPQTQVAELLSQFCEEGRLNARFIKVESEHSAMAALVGASTAGARTFTATSAQGLALMHEMLHWASGARLPIVMANVNRAMGAPWSVWNDQNDSLSQRDTGWLQFYCESNQEVLDTILQAYRVAETVLLPAMVVLDAFVLSHTAEPVEFPEQAQVDAYLPPFRPKDAIDLDDPKSYSSLATPDSYMEFRFKLQTAMERAEKEIEKAGRDFEKRFGRAYDLVEGYRTDDAELIIVTSGTITSTARVTVDELRRAGRKVGLLKMRVFRPFPSRRVREHLAHARQVAVIDRNIGFGVGGIFAQEIRAALYGHSSVPVHGYVVGLGGRDVSPDTILEIVDHASASSEQQSLTWIGVKR